MAVAVESCNVGRRGRLSRIIVGLLLLAFVVVRLVSVGSVFEEEDFSSLVATFGIVFLGSLSFFEGLSGFCLFNALFGRVDSEVDSKLRQLGLKHNQSRDRYYSLILSSLSFIVGLAFVLLEISV